MMKVVVAAGAAVAVLGLAACGNSAEQAGENMDSAIEETFQGEENLGDGAFERAGEAVDSATGQERQDDLGDAINDATDGDSRTNP